MIFVLLVVLCNLLLVPSKRVFNENTVTMKLPRPMRDESSVEIGGTFNRNSTLLQITIKGNKTEKLGKPENCSIIIKPQDDTIMISGAEVKSYSFNINKEDTIIPFQVKISAMSMCDGHSLTVGFNGNGCGLSDLEEPCMFKSLDQVDSIVFKDFKHIRTLTFEYKENDEFNDSEC